VTLRLRALDLLLWYAVFAWGSWVGGTLYQMLVVVPMWSPDPPESVVEFFTGTAYNETIWNFFGPPFMAARLLPLVLALALAWDQPRHRTALLVAVVCLATAVAFTLGYVYPINAVLFARAGGDHTAAEIEALVRTWIWADRARFAVGVVAFIAIMRAFRLPLPEVDGTAER